MQSSNILIVQNYNINKGDYSVVATMLGGISHLMPEMQTRVTSYDPESASQKYGTDCVPWFMDIRWVKEGNSLFGILFRLVWELLLCGLIILIALLLPGQLLYLTEIVPERKKSTIRAYFQADVVVLPGGHFFTTLNKLPVVISHSLAMFFAFSLRKKTMVFAQTVGPFEGKARSMTKWLSKRVFSKVDVVTLRDKLSYRLYANWCRNVALTAETVFYSKKTQSYAITRKPYVGLTIHHIYYQRFFSEEDYIERMARICEDIVAVTGLDILFITMEHESAGRSTDRTMCESIRSATKCQERMQISDNSLSSEEIQKLIGEASLFVGTKTHSIVYGLKQGTPTIGIAYQEKSTYFMELFGADSFSIPLVELTPDAFHSILQDLWPKKDDVSAMLSSRGAEVSQKAEENFTYLKRLVMGN